MQVQFRTPEAGLIDDLFALDGLPRVGEHVYLDGDIYQVASVVWFIREKGRLLFHPAVQVNLRVPEDSQVDTPHQAAAKTAARMTEQRRLVRDLVNPEAIAKLVDERQPLD